MNKRYTAWRIVAFETTSFVYQIVQQKVCQHPHVHDSYNIDHCLFSVLCAFGVLLSSCPAGCDWPTTRDLRSVHTTLECESTKMHVPPGPRLDVSIDQKLKKKQNK